MLSERIICVDFDVDLLVVAAIFVEVDCSVHRYFFSLGSVRAGRLSSFRLVLALDPFASLLVSRLV